MHQLMTPFTWSYYSKKLQRRLKSLSHAGKITQEVSRARGMRCIQASYQSSHDPSQADLYWEVDLEDGVIADARFQAFGPTALIGALDVACELSLRKTYDQAGRISPELIDQALRDKSGQIAFPDEVLPFLELVCDLLVTAANQCVDIPLPSQYVTPISATAIEEGNGYPGWIDLSHEKKIAVIEQVLDSDIRPYIELDAGGVEILKLSDEKELFISYQGSCTSCYSAVGTTLSYIQQIVKAKVHPDLTVIPDFGNGPSPANETLPW